MNIIRVTVLAFLAGITFTACSSRPQDPSIRIMRDRFTMLKAHAETNQSEQDHIADVEEVLAQINKKMSDKPEDPTTLIYRGTKSLREGNLILMKQRFNLSARFYNQAMLESKKVFANKDEMRRLGFSEDRVLPESYKLYELPSN